MLKTLRRTTAGLVRIAVLGSGVDDVLFLEGPLDVPLGKVHELRLCVHRSPLRRINLE